MLLHLLRHDRQEKHHYEMRADLFIESLYSIFIWDVFYR